MSKLVSTIEEKPFYFMYTYIDRNIDRYIHACTKTPYVDANLPTDIGTYSKTFKSYKNMYLLNTQT
jgi:hypothetical protein